MKSKRTYIILMALCLAICVEISAQTPLKSDVMIAYMKDHSTQGAYLGARGIMEQANEALHGKLASSEGQYKAFCDSLDTYRKYFDVADLIYSSLHTGYHVYRCIDKFKTLTGDYIEMLDEYRELATAKGPIKQDLELYNNMNELISIVRTEAKYIGEATAMLFSYATGKIPCTLSNWTMMINFVNDRLDVLLDSMYDNYMKTKMYILRRKSYWKVNDNKHNGVPVITILNNTLDRWHQAADAAARYGN